MYTIEKNVPLPTNTRALLRQMEIGDSFAIPLKSCGSVRAAASQVQQILGRTYKVIKQGDGARVWRTA